MEIQALEQRSFGLNIKDSLGKGLFVGEMVPIAFPQIASLADGVAIATIQAKSLVAAYHRDGTALHHRFCYGIGDAATVTAAAAGTDPAWDIYRHLPTPPAIVGAALISPAAAGNTDDGAHDFGVEFVNAAGDTTPGPVVSVTVADKTTNGKVVLPLPIGPTGTTARKIISSKAGAHVLYVAATVSDNTTETYTYNIADSSLSVGAAIANTAMQSVFAATVKLSSTTRSLCDGPTVGLPTAVTAADVWENCIYSLHALTGASSGALTGLDVKFFVEFVK